MVAFSLCGKAFLFKIMGSTLQHYVRSILWATGQCSVWTKWMWSSIVINIKGCCFTLLLCGCCQTDIHSLCVRITAFRVWTVLYSTVLIICVTLRALHSVAVQWTCFVVIKGQIISHCQDVHLTLGMYLKQLRSELCFQNADFLRWHSVEPLITAVVVPFTAALQTLFVKVEEGYFCLYKDGYLPKIIWSSLPTRNLRQWMSLYGYLWSVLGHSVLWWV